MEPRDLVKKAVQTLDDFDLAFQEALDRDRVLELATLDSVHRGQNLLVAGMSGTGKSHICIALGYPHPVHHQRRHAVDAASELRHQLARQALSRM